MKKVIIFLLLSTLILGGCGNSVHEARYQAKGKTAFKNQNKNAHVPSESDKQKNSSSVSSRIPSTKNAKNSKTTSQYVVPKSIKKSAKYVSHGALTQPKQFSYDSFGTKLTLDKFKKVNQTIITRPLKYQITQVRLLKNEAKTEKAKKVVATAFNNTDINSTYYTLQIKYTIKNDGNTEAIIGGLNYVKLSSSYAGTPLSNMVDGSAGKHVGSGKTISTNVMTLVPDNLVHSLKTCTIQFSGSYRTDGKNLSKESLVTDIDF
ncbi:hypothetical protein NVV78_04175 [Pediococcus ethanolidurans]|uniref:hypothetical protein n=1 Tax=Pediococcus ethanolidurans TaxID=319653 RepID=UPI001C1E9177|nr:hypothetical protein [Pediococcus ethanolidurans]MBU7555702.1 hypothetical protein [Pediococcus ethanolidurans]MCT4397149.1 hypothetical protein [Pediococcus ethanolidurans]MCV3315145.1 hypothetical protein [Pediococcus ethanolidurans]